MIQDRFVQVRNGCVDTQYTPTTCKMRQIIQSPNSQIHKRVEQVLSVTNGYDLKKRCSFEETLLIFWWQQNIIAERTQKGFAGVVRLSNNFPWRVNWQCAGSNCFSTVQQQSYTIVREVSFCGQHCPYLEMVHILRQAPINTTILCDTPRSGCLDKNELFGSHKELSSKNKPKDQSPKKMSVAGILDSWD